MSFWQWALEASGEDIFSYGCSHKKLTLAGGLRTCPSWCCCCVLLSFPCQQNGETQRVGSRSSNSVYSYEITGCLVYIRIFSFCAFFLDLFICWISVPNKAVGNGKGLYSSHDFTEILHLSHFCYSCSAKYSWRKRGEEKFSPPICLLFPAYVFFFCFPIPKQCK